MAAPSSEPTRVGSRGRRCWPVGSTAPEATHVHSGGVTPASRLPPSVKALYIPSSAARHTCRSSLSFFPALRCSAGPAEALFLPPPFSDDPAMDHVGGSSFGGGGAPESNWPQCLDKPLTQELFNFGLLVPPGYRLAKPWRICKDGYPTLTNPATPEQLRVHPSGRYNTHGRHAFWDGKNYNDVIRRCRQVAAAGVGSGEGVTVGRRSPPTSGGPGGGPGYPDGVRGAAGAVRPPRG
ncbi:hypothetical protein ZWY2020_029733 [Hordeum vulgare]|nr:hypothetical protein ZWY2020_029733 [Hordeum vulgare]